MDNKSLYSEGFDDDLGDSDEELPNDIEPEAHQNGSKRKNVEMTGCNRPIPMAIVGQVGEDKRKLQSLQLNTNKAGMEGLDTVKINEIIQKASEGSKYYHHKQKCQERIDSRITEMKSRIAKFTNDQINKAEDEMTKLGLELERSRDLSKTIVHIDMDMFYAAVEMRDDPTLREKPMAVGSKYMLSTSNYAARKFGVRAAMPGFIGKKLCPSLVIVPCNFDKYKEVSSQVQRIFEEYDPQFCPMSLDEAYLDITDYLLLNEEKYSQRDSKQTTAEAVVEEIRRKIHEKTELTASAGIASNTRLAKVCSDLNKPNGQYYLSPNKEVIEKFVKDLPIRKVSGIGNVSEQQLKALGVTKCSDLWTHRGLLRLLFSENSSNYFMSIALGLGSTEIVPATERDRKSISNETTFAGTSDRKYLTQLCEDLCADLKRDMERKNLFGKVLTLKVKTTEFKVRTRAQTLPEYTQDLSVMRSVSQKLLLNELETGSSSKEPLSLRLLGVRMSSLVDKSQLSSKKQVTLTDLFRKSMHQKYNIDTRDASLSTGDDSCEIIEVIENYDKPRVEKSSISRHNELEGSEGCSTHSVSESGNILDNKASISDKLFSHDSVISDNNASSSDKLLSHDSVISENNASISERLFSPDSADVLSNSKTSFKAESSCNGNEPSCSTGSQTSFLCPVCSIKKFIDMEALNNHIDTCLNVQVVQELVKETNSSFKNSPKKSPEFKLKRKTVELSRRSNKKRKMVSNSSNTLHKYLVME